MELFPQLRIGWLNGWILLAFEFLIQGSLLLVFPKSVVSRLFDRSGWSVKQQAFTVIGKLFSLACLVLIILTPLAFTSSGFILGLVLYAIGIAGLVIAMLNFRDTPPGQPVAKGIYRISRHPQLVALFVLFLTLVASRVLQHYGILAEEEVCLKQYGESYRAYMQKVPRYLLFF
jgi:protein-S-isoprenylcysteine O-methyltransferase Ste14